MEILSLGGLPELFYFLVLKIFISVSDNQLKNKLYVENLFILVEQKLVVVGFQQGVQ